MGWPFWKTLSVLWIEFVKWRVALVRSMYKCVRTIYEHGVWMCGIKRMSAGLERRKKKIYHKKKREEKREKQLFAIIKLRSQRCFEDAAQDEMRRQTLGRMHVSCWMGAEDLLSINLDILNHFFFFYSSIIVIIFRNGVTRLIDSDTAWIGVGIRSIVRFSWVNFVGNGGDVRVNMMSFQQKINK